MPRPAVLALAAAFLAAGCASAPRQAGPRAPVLYVERDTTWSGEVPVPGIVHVRKDATLTIRPGARIVFATAAFPPADEHEGFTGPGIRVEGRIVAEGTAESPVVFTSQAAAAAPASWDKILFSFSTGNRFLHCVFEGARYAFHAHFSEIAIESCVFRDNEEGVRLGTSRVSIERSVFTRNAIRGINFRECRNEIRGNLVYENGDGIFLHSRDALSVIRENAIYNNRGYNLRLGDLHDEEIDVSGNWWGTASESRALATVYDGRALPGIGRAVLAPILSAPPVAGAELRGVVVREQSPVAGAEVRAYSSAEDGFRAGGMTAAATADAEGAFRLAVPPGRYFVVAWGQGAEGVLFGFPGRNPVAVGLGEKADVGIPTVAAGGRQTTAPSARPSVRVTVTASGKPVDGAAVRLFRAQAPDFRGAGEASGVTNAEGTATLYPSPGRYHVVAKRRTGGERLGMVEEGGLFGVFPDSPVRVAEGTSVSVEIPLFEKRGFLSGDDARATDAPDGPSGAAATAMLDGRPAAGYVVYFYGPRETVGRPLARSSVVSSSGAFEVSLPAEGEYAAFLRKAAGTPGEVEEERLGPVPVRFGGRRIVPAALLFRPAAR